MRSSSKAFWKGAQRLSRDLASKSFASLPEQGVHFSSHHLFSIFALGFLALSIHQSVYSNPLFRAVYTDQGAPELLRLSKTSPVLLGLQNRIWGASSVLPVSALPPGTRSDLHTLYLKVSQVSKGKSLILGLRVANILQGKRLSELQL